MRWAADPCRAQTCDASDRGSIVLGWLTRVAVTIALLGIIGFEVLSIVVAKVQVQDIGQTAAHEALDNYAASRSAELAYQTASAYAESHGSEISRKSFRITDESVTFRLNKTATTLFLFRWDRSAGWADVHTVVYAEPLASGGQLS